MAPGYWATGAVDVQRKRPPPARPILSPPFTSGMRQTLVDAIFAVLLAVLACQGETITVEVPADTPTPQPTYTPYPTPEPVIETVVRYNYWIRQPSYGGGHRYVTVNTDEEEPVAGPWALWLECYAEGEPGAFMNNMQGNMFDEGDEGVQILLVEIDNDLEEQNWWYFPPDVPYSDYFSYYRAPDLIGDLLQARTVTFTIYTAQSLLCLPSMSQALSNTFKGWKICAAADL